MLFSISIFLFDKIKLNLVEEMNSIQDWIQSNAELKTTIEKSIRMIEKSIRMDFFSWKMQHSLLLPCFSLFLFINLLLWFLIPSKFCLKTYVLTRKTKLSLAQGLLFHLMRVRSRISEIRRELKKNVSLAS